MANHPHDKDRPESKAVMAAVEAGDMDALKACLSPRMRAFCHEYMYDYSAKLATIRAGYSTKFAEQQGAKLMKHRGIAAYIDHLSLSKEAAITAINPDYVIQKVTEIVTKEGSRDGDKLRGLELLARHLGMFIDRTEITGKDGGAIAVEQRKIEEDARSVQDLLRKLSERSTSDKKDVSLI